MSFSLTQEVPQEFLLSWLAALLALWNLWKVLAGDSAQITRRPAQVACVAVVFLLLLAGGIIEGTSLLALSAPGVGLPLANPRLSMAFFVAALVAVLIRLLLDSLDYFGLYPALNTNPQQNLRQAKIITVTTILLSIGGYTFYDVQIAMSCLIYGPLLSLILTESFRWVCRIWSMSTRSNR